MQWNYKEVVFFMPLKWSSPSASCLYPDLSRLSVGQVLSNTFWATPPLTAILSFNDNTIFEHKK